MNHTVLQWVFIYLICIYLYNYFNVDDSNDTMDTEVDENLEQSQDIGGIYETFI